MELWDLVSPIVTVAASFVGAWLAAHFALKRFYSEKLWERKTAAYTAIFEALHTMHFRYDALRESSATDTPIQEEARTKMQTNSHKAYEDLVRRMDSEIWLIPGACRARLQELLLDLDVTKNDDESLYTALSESTKRAIADLREMARADLGLRDSLWARAWQWWSAKG